MFRRDERAIQEWSPEHVKTCAVRQLAILESASQALREGGILVYSTCSLDGRENGDIVRAFLAQTSGFTLADERQTLPCEPHCDGFYAAKLIKT